MQPGEDHISQMAHDSAIDKIKLVREKLINISSEIPNPDFEGTVMGNFAQCHKYMDCRGRFFASLLNEALEVLE